MQELLSEIPRDLPPVDLDFVFTDPLPNVAQTPLELHRSPSPDRQSERPAKRSQVSIKEVADEDAPGRYVEQYPGNVGESLGHGEVLFKTLHKDQSDRGQSPWAPFEDEDEFQLSEWIIKRLGKNAIQEFLKQPKVRCPPTYFCHSNDP